MSEKEDTRSDKSSYNAQYGYIQVIETPAGHQIQIDNTPGHERLFWRHSSGTYTEVSADGKVVNFAVGDVKNYNKAGTTFTIDENGDIKFSGHGRIMVGGGAHIEVAGDAGIFVGGDTALASMGAANIRASSAILATDGDIGINAGGAINVKAAGNINMNGATINLN